MPRTTLLPTTPSLRASIHRPPSPPTGLAILAPPYPPLGGTHQDHVLQALAEHLSERYNSLSIAFSFPRPTSWTGDKEVQAYESVVKYGLGLLGDQARDVLLVGYSYGGLVTMRAQVEGLEGLRVRRVVISPPLGAVGWGLMLKRVPDRLEGEGLVIFGDNDNWTSKEAYREWVGELGRGWRGMEVEGNHFFERGVDGILRAVSGFLSDST